MKEIINSKNPNNGEHKNQEYIIVLCLFFFLLATVVAYLLRRYGRLTTTTGEAAENIPTQAPHGMDAQEIESLPSLRFSEIIKTDHLRQLECTVCINEFKGEDDMIILPDCLHVFHPHCIEPWLSKHATCPVCRSSLERGSGSSASLSTVVIERFSGTLSQRFDRVDDHDDEDLTVEIEESSRLECVEQVDNNSNNNNVEYCCSLRRCFSTGELNVRIVGGNSQVSKLSIFSRHIDLEVGVNKSITP